MTPKEKAIDLFYKMNNEYSYAIEFGNTRPMTKNLALICVDEMIKTLIYINDGIQSITTKIDSAPDKELMYWQEVKKEIEKL